MGPPDQPDYLNAAAQIGTGLSPEDLLDALQRIETRQGRARGMRWGPRTIDLDLLLFGDREIDLPGLRVPHPRMAERRFVLEPLLAAWPAASLPSARVSLICQRAPRSWP